MFACRCGPFAAETQAFDGDYVAGMWSRDCKGHSFSSETSAQSGLTRASSTLTSLDDGEALPEPLEEEVARMVAPALQHLTWLPPRLCLRKTPHSSIRSPCNALALQTQPDLSMHAPTIMLKDKCEEVEHDAVQPEQPKANPASTSKPMQVCEPKPPCTENPAADAEPGNCPAEDDETPVNPARQGLGLEQKPASTSMAPDSVLNFQAGLGLHHVLLSAVLGHCVYDVHLQHDCPVEGKAMPALTRSPTKTNVAEAKARLAGGERGPGARAEPKQARRLTSRKVAGVVVAGERVGAVAQRSQDLQSSQPPTKGLARVMSQAASLNPSPRRAKKTRQLPQHAK